MKRVVIIGDSHADAIKRALRGYKSQICDIQAFRYSKLKNGTMLGDMTESQVDVMVSGLHPDDLVVSAIGGNQHQAFSLVQHPERFSVMDEDGLPTEDDLQSAIIPRAQIWDFFESKLRTGLEGSRLGLLKAKKEKNIYHLTPPPPKQSLDHVARKFEESFLKAGILEKGISPPSLRLAIWKIQVDVTEKLTKEWGIKMLPNPDGSRCANGFLAHQYYGADATHANDAYGMRVLLQLEDLVARETQ